MRNRRGFTLVELIIMIMILGILATIAIPRFLETSVRSIDNTTRFNLSVVRNAIELYAADNDGKLPGLADDLPGDLSMYISGDFPQSLPKSGSHLISYYDSDTAALTPDDSTCGWRYSQKTGEFIVNSGDPLVSDSSLTYDQL